MFRQARTYVTKAKRTQDPLARAANADRYTLAEGSQFVVRPPPSQLPPLYPVSIGRGETELLAKRETNGFLKSVLKPVSALQQDPPKQTGLPLPAPKPKSTQLSQEQIKELQTLRQSDPVTWSWSRLAEKYNVSKSAIATLAWEKRGPARRAQAAHNAAIDSTLAAAKAKWGWRKTIVREERRNRKLLW